MNILIALSDNATDAQLEESAWKTFALAHPHEAYATWPARFWKFHQEVAPTIPREVMEATLRETDTL